MVQGHYWSSSVSTDPWNKTWTSNGSGLASGSFMINAGYNTAAENLGHAVVVHESTGDRAACGVLGGGMEYVSTMGIYPDYDGDVTVTGYVVVAEESAGSNSIR